jgi:hypothetical protein
MHDLTGLGRRTRTSRCSAQILGRCELGQEAAPIGQRQAQAQGDERRPPRPLLE